MALEMVGYIGDGTSNPMSKHVVDLLIDTEMRWDNIERPPLKGSFEEFRKMVADIDLEASKKIVWDTLSSELELVYKEQPDRVSGEALSCKRCNSRATLHKVPRG